MNETRLLEIGDVVHWLDDDGLPCQREAIEGLSGTRALTAGGLWIRRRPAPGGNYKVAGRIDPAYVALETPELKAAWEKLQLCKALREFDWESLSIEELQYIYNIATPPEL